MILEVPSEHLEEFLVCLHYTAAELDREVLDDGASLESRRESAAILRDVKDLSVTRPATDDENRFRGDAKKILRILELMPEKVRSHKERGSLSFALPLLTSDFVEWLDCETERLRRRIESDREIS